MVHFHLMWPSHRSLSLGKTFFKPKDMNIFLCLHRNIRCEYSLKPPWRDDSRVTRFSWVKCQNMFFAYRLFLAVSTNPHPLRNHKNSMYLKLILWMFSYMLFAAADDKRELVKCLYVSEYTFFIELMACARI